MTAHLHRSLRPAGKPGVGSTNQRDLDESDAYLAVFLLSRATRASYSSFDVISLMHDCYTLRLNDVKVEEVHNNSWKFHRNV